MKHLLSIGDLGKDDIIGLMDEADRFREALEGRELKKLPTLRGRTIFTLFYENSTRTRSSFETAGKWMSADVIHFRILILGAQGRIPSGHRAHA